MPRRNNGVTVAFVLAAASAGLMLAGCEEYRERTDGVSMGLGNANAHNIAVQTVDPWSPYSRNSKINIDGDRANIGIQRYKANKSLEPQGLTTQKVNEEKSDNRK